MPDEKHAGGSGVFIGHVGDEALNAGVPQEIAKSNNPPLGKDFRSPLLLCIYATQLSGETKLGSVKNFVSTFSSQCNSNFSHRSSSPLLPNI